MIPIPSNAGFLLVSPAHILTVMIIPGSSSAVGLAKSGASSTDSFNNQ
jgi:hypothetical protein